MLKSPIKKGRDGEVEICMILLISVCLITGLFASVSFLVHAGPNQTQDYSSANSSSPNNTPQGQPVKHDVFDEKTSNQARFFLLVVVGICIIIGYTMIMYSLFKIYAKGARSVKGVKNRVGMKSRGKTRGSTRKGF